MRHQARLQAPLETVWQRALDIETVAGCFPGATASAEGDGTFTGRVSVRLGPIGLTYVGAGRYEEIDPDRGRIRLRAQGAQSRGVAQAAIHVVLDLAAHGGETSAEIQTDLEVNGSSLPLAGPLGERVAGPLVRTFLRRLGSPDDPRR